MRPVVRMRRANWRLAVLDDLIGSESSLRTLYGMPGTEMNHDDSKFGEKAYYSVISIKHYIWDLRYEARDLLCHDGLKPARSEQRLRELGKGSNDRFLYCGRGTKMHKIPTVAKTSSAYFVLTMYVAPQGHYYSE